MTRLLFTSDWHVDATTAGLERADELEAYVAAIAARLEDTSKPRIDILVNPGDYFDPGSLLECRWSATLIRHVSVLHSRIGRSVWLTGNHDVIETSGGWSILSPLSEAAIAGWVPTRPGFPDFFRAPDIVEVPTLLDFAIFRDSDMAADVQPLAILALPYVARSIERSAKYAAMYRKVLEEAATRRNLIVVGHLTIPGITPGSEDEMPRGRDMIFPVDEIAELRPMLVVNGHYHARQSFRAKTSSGEFLTIEIPGAPTRFTFGERDDGDRGWLEVEV